MAWVVVVVVEEIPSVVVVEVFVFAVVVVHDVGAVEFEVVVLGSLVAV